jgi:hypothetical protein
MPSDVKEVTVKKSGRPDKKYTAVLSYTDGKTKKVNFGAKGYEDFTIHKDPERKERYLARHKNDSTSIETAGFWARDLLWNKPSL